MSVQGDTPPPPSPTPELEENSPRPKYPVTPKKGRELAPSSHSRGSSGTPRSNKAISSSAVSDREGYKSKGQENFNSAMAPPVVVTDIEDFCSLLPFHVDADAVRRAEEKLLDKGLLMKTGDDCLEFKHFPRNESASFPGKEKDVFGENFTEIMLALSGIEVGDRERVLEYKRLGEHAHVSSIPGANFRSDAVLCPVVTTVPHSSNLADDRIERVDLMDMAINIEFKTANNMKNKIDNRQKVASNSTIIMNDDPKRKYCYGVTIDGKMLSIWFFSRSVCVKSLAFNFTKDTKRFIHIMLSLLFASMSEIGYNDAIERRLDDVCDSSGAMKKQICHVYRVYNEKEERDEFYKTVESISEHWSRCIVGRATRVWKVKRVHSFDDLRVVPGDDRSLVLKDAWLDIGASTEGEILEAIFKKLEEFYERIKDKPMEELDDEDRAKLHGVDEETIERIRETLEDEKYRDYFLTIRVERKGEESKPRPKESYQIDSLFDVPDKDPKAAHQQNADESRTSHSGIFTQPMPAPGPGVPSSSKSRYFQQKCQYIVVYEEICEALHGVDDLKKIFQAIRDCIFGLQLMFLAGWVHRDISSGNLLWCDIRGKKHGILSDLEYAKEYKPFKDLCSVDPKTGTPYFMAVEIQKGSLLFTRIDDEFLEEFLDRIPGVEDWTTYVVHNFQHDLESVFWLLLWTVMERIPHGPSNAKAQALFGLGPSCVSERGRYLISFRLLRITLQNVLHPSLQLLVKPISKMQGDLGNGYEDRKLRLDDWTTFSSLYAKLREQVNICQQFIGNCENEIPELVIYGRVRTKDTKKRTRAVEDEASFVYGFRPPTRARTGDVDDGTDPCLSG